MEIEESQGQELRNYDDLYITFAHTDQSLFSAIAGLWNVLPNNLKILRNRHEFNVKLKQFMISQLSDVPHLPP